MKPIHIALFWKFYPLPFVDLEYRSNVDVIQLQNNIYSVQTVLRLSLLANVAFHLVNPHRETHASVKMPTFYEGCALG